MVGKNPIHDLRAENGLSVSELAATLGVKPATVKKWETGNTTPADTKLLRLSELFNVDIDVLYKVAPRCKIHGCDRRLYQDGICKEHFSTAIRPVITAAFKEAKTLGERLKILRMGRSLSAKNIASTFGVTVGTIRAWENNLVKPTLIMLIDISYYFSISTRVLERGVKSESDE